MVRKQSLEHCTVSRKWMPENMDEWFWLLY